MMSGWARGAQMASILLATGSMLLLLGVLAFLGAGGWSGGLAWLATLSWLAVLVHLIGWIALFRAIFEIGPEPRMKKVLSVFFLSLMGFAVGVLSLPIFFPAAGGWYYLPPWAGVLLFGVFPYMPSVFGPVVVAHAVIFMLGSSDFTRRIALASIVAGGAVLSLLAIVGIALQVLNVPQSFPAPLAPISLTTGLTFLGYALVAAGYRLEGAPQARRAISRQDA